MENSSKSKVPQLKDLPLPLQQKYKNSLLFNKKDSKMTASSQNFDLKKLQQRKIEKEKTMEEKLEEYKINPTEEKYLHNVFKMFSGSASFFEKQNIKRVLHTMNIKMTEAEIDLMIWEFDQDLNKCISEKEFINMYKKCTIDKTGAESKNLFHLTQFLMYCRPNHYKVTVEDTLELLYVRAKKEADTNKTDVKDLLEEEIKAIFGNQERTPDEVEKEIDFKEYLEKINKRAIEKRKQEILQAKALLKC